MNNINWMQSKTLAAGETWPVSVPKERDTRIIINWSQPFGSLRISYDDTPVDAALSPSDYPTDFFMTGNEPMGYLQLNIPNLLLGDMLYFSNHNRMPTIDVSIWITSDNTKSGGL